MATSDLKKLFRLQYDWSGWRTLAVLWLVFISILFILPGSAFPKDNWLKNIQFDKLVHFGLFAALTFLWRFYLTPSVKSNGLIIFFSLVYGFGVEAVQHNFVANRSFDIWDVVADSAGAVAGLWFWWYRYERYIKKINPCRNRGRNQN